LVQRSGRTCGFGDRRKCSGIEEFEIIVQCGGSRFQQEQIFPTFSLIFTKFESEGFLFHTMWQVDTWQKCAFNIWKMLILMMLN
jgi:hypothetical protein